MHRVFFDTNAGSKRDGYILWFDKSKDDIEMIPAENRNGTEVLLYMPEEIEVPARLYYDNNLDCWRGFPI